MKSGLCALLASVTLLACSDPPPPAGQLDGSFLVGDAPAAPDAVPRDATVGRELGPTDGDPTADGAMPGEVGPRDGDAPVDMDGAIAPDAGPPDPCAATATVTVTATSALARAGEMEGTLVDVVATATISVAACTALACTPEAPCCNACSADVLLEGVLPLRAGACTPRVGCTGDECNLVCSPPVLGFPQTFRGVVRSAPSPGLELMRVLP